MAKQVIHLLGDLAQKFVRKRSYQRKNIFIRFEERQAASNKDLDKFHRNFVGGYTNIIVLLKVYELALNAQMYNL